MNSPIICFGQQPCGIFPKRFLVAKINTARNLQQQIGGKIVFFYHDSDADYRETITILNDIQTGVEARLNFTQENKIQKKYSPLYLKRIPEGWKAETLKQLPRFVNTRLINIFESVNTTTAADFCLEIYQKMGLLNGIEVIRSSDKTFREQAPELQEYFADISFQGEIVRAQFSNGKFQVHEGGGKYLEIPTPTQLEKFQKNPGKDERFGWMNSVILSTHYIFGEGEKAYLKTEDFPEVNFILRESIPNPNHAWIDLN